jgi:hypothetical protein
MADNKDVMQTCQLINFDKATIYLHEELMITPDPTTLLVEGVVNSLGVNVALHQSGIEVSGADA